jgi:hypothetical protein
MPKFTTPVPAKATPRGHASPRNTAPSRTANRTSAACIVSAAPSATGWSRTMPVASKKRIVAMTPALNPTPAASQAWPCRRKSGFHRRPDCQCDPRRLTGQGQSKHALGRFQFDPGALQVQKQATVAKWIQEGVPEHARQRGPSTCIQCTVRVHRDTTRVRTTCRPPRWPGNYPPPATMDRLRRQN